MIIRYTTLRSNRNAVPSLCAYFEQNWQMFEMIVRAYPTNESVFSSPLTRRNVIESMCRFFKYFMRLDRDAFLQLLQRTVTLILDGYASSAVNSYVYLGGVIIGEYGYYESCQELVTRILKVFCDSTLPVLQKSRDAYDENPYLVEDFYDLCGRTIQNTPALFFRDTNMLLLVTQAAVQGIQLQHREANNSLMRYLESLLSYGQEVEKEEGELALNPINYRDRVLSVLSVCGQEMMNQLVAALTGGLPESRLKDSNVSVVSVLYNYYDYFNDLFIQAMANTIATIPERILSSAEKHQFMAVGEGRGDDA